jgi:hypothetical protein
MMSYIMAICIYGGADSLIPLNKAAAKDFERVFNKSAGSFRFTVRSFLDWSYPIFHQEQHRLPFHFPPTL